MPNFRKLAGNRLDGSHMFKTGVAKRQKLNIDAVVAQWAGGGAGGSMDIYIYIYICMYVCMYVCVYIYIYICIHT